jgi:hypothetical protein
MKPAQDYTNTFVRPKFTGETERGAPSPECTAPKPEGAGLSHTSTPIEFFNTFLDDLWVKQNLVRNTNMSASIFGGVHDDGTLVIPPFSVAEMKKFIGLEIANGVSPKHNHKHWFQKPGGGSRGPPVPMSAARALFSNPTVAAHFPNGLRRYFAWKKFVTLKPTCHPMCWHALPPHPPPLCTPLTT